VAGAVGGVGVVDGRFVLDHVVNRMEAQRQDVAGIRNQASIAAAATGLVATFFATIFASEEVVYSLNGGFILGFKPTVFFLGGYGLNTF